MESQPQTPRLLDQVRSFMRLHHSSIHTERSYLDWIKRYVHFHQMESRVELADAEAKIEAFLTNLAVNGKVSPSSQNQASRFAEFEMTDFRLQIGGCRHVRRRTPNI